MLQKAVNFAKGNAEIEVRGAYIERFLNLCSRNDINLWDIKRQDIDLMYVKIDIRDFRKLLRFNKHTKCKIKIVKKIGFPFFAWRFRKRYMMFIGFVMFLMVINIVATRIWCINIIADESFENLPTGELMRVLESNNIYIGGKTSQIDVRNTKNNVQTEFDDFAYIAVNIDGNTANIEITQKTPIPQSLEDDTPMNIIADKTGQIYKMEVTEGTAVVKVGQAVLEGDLLVDSLVIPRVLEREHRLTSSKANILIRTWSENTHIMPMEIQKKEYTGEEKSKYSLIFGKNRVNLYFNSGIPYDTYDKIVVYEEVYLNESFVFPVSLVKERYVEYNLVSGKISEDSAREIMIAGFDKLYLDDKNQVVDAVYTLEEFEQNYILKVSSECIEEVGVRVLDNRTREDVTPMEKEEID